MSDELMIRHCSPTLAGIKTGSLFTCPCRCRQRLTAEICRLNRMLVPKGLRVLPLRIRQGRALIYVYRPRVLARDLQDSRARDLLVSLGYVPEQAEQCVIHLIRRLAAQQDGPAHTESVFINGKLKVDYAAGCAFLDGQELHLTPSEFKLLCLLSKNVGKVLTHTYITQQIWGRSWENDVASLRVFMATLRKKLEAAPNSPQYIQTHIGVGYRMLRVEEPGAL